MRSMPSCRGTTLVLIVLCFGLVHDAAAHGGEEHDMGQGDYLAELGEQPEHKALNYFRYADYWNWHLAHTVCMMLAWVVFMPVAIFLSVARSSLHLPAQVVFHCVQGLGLFVGIVYNRSTPDLYSNNAHHTLGWVIVALTVVWTVLSACNIFTDSGSNRSRSSHQSLEPALETISRLGPNLQYSGECSSRASRDSGQGTERNSESLFGSRQNSTDQIEQRHVDFENDICSEEEKLDESEPERQNFLGRSSMQHTLRGRIRQMSSPRVRILVRGLCVMLEKTLLVLGFAALASGFIVSGGLFRDRQVYSGLAHYIKGGIFFWYGLLTLGRWMGAFTEFGWAWNIRPQRPTISKWKSMVPSAEFTESFVIWLYGATNVFLEHLNSWGKAWSATDLEHLSITILFFGGGLLGMLIESKWVQKLTSTTSASQKREHSYQLRFAASYADPEKDDQQWEEPESYQFSINPMPALTIMLLGMMMGGHHQSSMVSTMMHAQWGGLFSAFAVARGVTYIIMYLKPPTSHFPSRPPSELIASFCLTGGGLMFMNSAADTVRAIEWNGLDAMTIFTLSMGLTGVILSWEIVLFAIKGWAVRRERAALGELLD